MDNKAEKSEQVKTKTEQKKISKKSKDNLASKYRKVQSIGSVPVPHNVWTILGTAKYIEIVGPHISVGVDTDFASLEDVKKAVSWLVEQLDGEVAWK